MAKEEAVIERPSIVQSKPMYFPALTGIRAIAAYMVFFFHVAQTIPINGTGLQIAASLFVRQWHMGVAIFFVLSGFLITTRYQKRITLSRQWIIFYMQNRFARIYPIYFLLTVASFIIMAVWPIKAWYSWPDYYTTAHKAGTVFFNLTLTRAFFRDLYLIGLPTAWSLTVEECFYISAPIILILTNGKLRRLVLFPMLFLAVGSLLVWVCSRVQIPFGLMKDMRFMLNVTFFGRCTEFALGMALALWFAKKQPHKGWKGLYTVLGLAGLVVFMSIIAFAQWKSPVKGTEDWPYEQIFANNIILPFIVCTLFYGILTEQTLFRKLLETKVFDLLGKSSYILYLIHLGVFDTLFTQYVTDNVWVRLVIYTMVSILLYKTVEHPLHNILRAKKK